MNAMFYHQQESAFFSFSHCLVTPEENYPSMERGDGCKDQSTERSLTTSPRKPVKWSLECEDDQEFDEKKVLSFSENSNLAKSHKEEIFVVAKHLGLEDRWIRKERNEEGLRGRDNVNHMLREWIRRNGRDATCGSLRKGLQRASDEIQR